MKPDPAYNHGRLSVPFSLSPISFFPPSASPLCPRVDGDNCFMPAGSKALYAGSFILRLLRQRAARGGGRGGRGPGLINNYALPLLFRLAFRLSFVLLSPSLTLSLTHSLAFSVSRLLFFSAAVAAATLRLICVDGPKHTGRRAARSRETRSSEN